MSNTHSSKNAMKRVLFHCISFSSNRCFLRISSKEASLLFCGFIKGSGFGSSNELILMSHLDVMISMDSGNMHLASLVGTKVVSIWGATHPYAGFMGWNQSEENAVQLDMACRPCSVYGNKPCLRGDYACMNDIRPEMIVAKIKQLFN